MTKIISINQYPTKKHDRPAIDIVVTHELNATLGEVAEAHDKHIATLPDLRIFPQAEVRFMFGDPDYGSTYSIFTHYLIPDNG